MIGRITGYLKVHCISDYTENKIWTKKQQLRFIYDNVIWLQKMQQFNLNWQDLTTIKQLKLEV